MVRFLHSLLGLNLVLYATSAPSLEQYLLYDTTSLIRQLAQQQVGRFEVVFLDLDPGPHLFDGWLEDLVTALVLENVLRYVLNSRFKLTHLNLPNKPGLVVVHVGNRVLYPPQQQVNEFFSTLDSNSRILVLVDTSSPVYVRGIVMLLSSLQFDKVVYMGIKQQLVLQLNFRGQITHTAKRLANLADRFKSNIRNSQGRPVRYSFTRNQWPEISMWVQETVRFLNTNALRVVGVCTREMTTWDCISKLFYAVHVDICLDRIGSQGYSPQFRHALFDFQPVSDVIIVPQGRPFNAVEMFINPFTVETWIVVILILVLMEVISFIFPTLFQNDPILLLVCGFERYNLHRTSTKEKTTLLPLMVFFFLMFNAYETKLISFMMNKPSIEPISTIQNLNHSGIKIKADLLGHPDLANDSTIGSLFVNQESFGELDGSNAYLTDSLTAPKILILPSNYDFKLRRPKYVLINEKRFTTISIVWMGMKTPLSEMFLYTQKVFFESGLYIKWQQQYDEAEIRIDRASLQNSSVSDLDWLTFQDLESTWAVLFIGLFISLMAFVVELLVKYCKKCY